MEDKIKIALESQETVEIAGVVYDVIYNASILENGDLFGFTKPRNTPESNSGVALVKAKTDILVVGSIFNDLNDNTVNVMSWLLPEEDTTVEPRAIRQIYAGNYHLLTTIG